MDIGISDILADVSRTHQQQPSNRFSGQHQPQSPYDLTSSVHTDHQLLVRAWTSERSCPSLLPYPTPLIDRVMTRIRDQITRIEDMSSGIDVSFPSNANTHSNTHSNMNMNMNVNSGRNTNLILSILQTDLSRTQFILRSYLRQRLSKITKHAVWYLKYLDRMTTSTSISTTASTSTSTTATKNPLLSPAETKFLQSHQALLSEFYDNSFLSSFPANLKRLDDSAGGVGMVEGPDGGSGVVVRCLSGRWDNVGEVNNVDGDVDGDGDGIGDGDGDGDGTVEGKMKADVELRMRRGEVWVIRWRDVKRGVVRGDLELL